MPEKLRSLRFNYNRNAARYISIFFVIEQFLYGIYFSEPGSTLQLLYFITALIAAVIFISTFLTKRIYLDNISPVANVIELVAMIAGFSIPLVRIYFHPGILDYIPTIFSAIIYGSAVIFILDYWQSILSYSLLMLASILIITHFRVAPYNANMISDIVVNVVIACIMSCTNFRFFKRQNSATLKIELQNDQLKMLSEIDQLTGLYNRRKINELFESSHEDKFNTSILFDIDNFKRINDTYGHLVGDDILIKMGEIVKKTVGKNDIVIRWGGEEFLIFTSLNRNLAETLRRKIEATKFTQNIYISASFGVAHRADYESITELLRALDKKLYKAKSSGKNCVIY